MSVLMIKSMKQRYTGGSLQSEIDGVVYYNYFIPVHNVATVLF